MLLSLLLDAIMSSGATVAVSQAPAARFAGQHGQLVRQESSPVRLATELVSLSVAMTNHSGSAEMRPF